MTTKTKTTITGLLTAITLAAVPATDAFATGNWRAMVQRPHHHIVQHNHAAKPTRLQFKISTHLYGRSWG